MATDNRTLLNACDADTDAWAGDGGASDNSEAGNFYEGGISQGVTLSNSLEREVCRTIGGTRDLSDSQVWVVVKDGLASSRAAGGFQVVIEDAADEIGFFVGGFDFLPMGLPSFFWSLRLDVSESGVFDTASETTAYGGSFAGLDETSIIGVGYGTIHAAKAKSENAYIDGLYFIANGSYATTIDAGTVGTPDTFALVVADDVTNGTGTWSNLQGDKFDTNASWEWGVSANQDSYFEDSGFQVFIDANDVGVGNFIVGLTAGSGTNSLVLSSGLFQNLGTPSVWDLSSANYNTVEFDLIFWNDIGTFSAPSSGGTSRFTTNCIWTGCGVITCNGADMSGSSVFTPAITANTSGLVWNENADPSGVLDDMTFSKTAGLAHHAIEFGTAIADAASFTLNGCNFGTDFSATEDGSVGDETFHFLDTTGTITLNLIGCSGNFGYRTEGVAVTIVVAPVVVQTTCLDQDGDPIENARVFVETADDGGGTGFPYRLVISSLTQSAGVATLTSSAAHKLVTGDYVVVRRVDENEYNKTAQITVTDTDEFTYAVDSGASSPATFTATDNVIDGQDETDYDNSPSTEGTFSGGTGHSISDVITLDNNIDITVDFAVTRSGDLHDGQDETSYNNSPTTEGVFDGGGFLHAVSDVITIDSGILITVDAVSGGTVTQFTVDSTGQTLPAQGGVLLDFVSSTGSGVSFSLTPDQDNIDTPWGLIGEVAEFTVDSTGQTGDVPSGTTLDQVSTTGSGSSFDLTTDDDNTVSGGDFMFSYCPLSGLTDSSGEISSTKSWPAAQEIKGWSRKSSAQPFFQSSNITGSVSTTLGYSAIITMLSDE